MLWYPAQDVHCSTRRLKQEPTIHVSNTARSFLIFNRPDLSTRVFQRIREARPKRLFIAADGPRAGRIGEPAQVQEAREIAARVDWPCELQTLFRDSNLGCKTAVSSAISWFFEQVPEGIILEDDCFPDPSFFPFCAELLDRFRDDERIMSIGADGYLGAKFHRGFSYAFSVYNLLWGWASWKRAWERYDGSMEAFDKSTQWLQVFQETPAVADHWLRQFGMAKRGELDSWGYPWRLSVWMNHGLNIVPNANLVTNIGFDQRSTHTANVSHWRAAVRTDPVAFPLKHPRHVARNIELDLHLSSEVFRATPQNWRSRLARWSMSLIKTARVTSP